MAEQVAALVAQGQLNVTNLIYTERARSTAEALAHTDLNRLIRPDGQAANFVGALEGWGRALAGGHPERRAQHE
jgi:hypothetical protein